MEVIGSGGYVVGCHVDIKGTILAYGNSSILAVIHIFFST
jgi:hypothetical protein